MTASHDYPPTFDGLVQILAHLRDPQEGCPWDLEQTHQSLRSSLLEECYEALEAIDQGEPVKLAEELGDLLLQVVFHAQIAREANEFSPEDVFRTVNEKLLRRHPHVFGEAQASTPREVEVQWEELKRHERSQRQEERSLLDGAPRTMPALAYSQALQERAARVGFDWEDVQGVLQKMDEEREELQRAESLEEWEVELGDLLFTMVNLSRWLKVDAESALRKAAARFFHRFTTMEARSQEQGVALGGLSMEEKEALWQQAKRDEESR